MPAVPLVACVALRPWCPGTQYNVICSADGSGPGTKTAWQHDGRMLPNGEITFFDDGANPPKHSQSRGLRIALDLQDHKAHLSASYTHPSPLLVASQGNMQTLPDGNVLIGNVSFAR